MCRPSPGLSSRSLIAMAGGTLYTYHDSFRAYKVVIAAQYSGAHVDIAPNFVLGETNKTDAFLKKFPLGKVPAFEAFDGTCIFESNAIANYVANEQLRGTNLKDAALIQQFINFADNEVLPAAATWVFPTYGIMQYNKQASEKAIDDIKICLEYLNKHLLTRTFLVGERISLADITVACYLLMLYKQVLEPSFREPYGNVNRWFMTLINQPEFKNVLGDVALCKTMAKFDAAKFAELHPKKQKEGKQKQEKQKQEKQPKQEKKKETPKQQEQPEQKAAPKKDPFVDLPKTTFDMDAFKREYSNKDIVTVAIPYFWEHFDKENMSIWHCEYMHNDELTRLFMTSNLVGGFFQRIEKLKKIGFATMCIYGEDNDNAISGVWVFRGKELGFKLSEDFQIDYVYYTFKRLDPDSEEDRKLFNNYLDPDTGGDVGGKKLYDYKVFK